MKIKLSKSQWEEIGKKAGFGGSEHIDPIQSELLHLLIPIIDKFGVDKGLHNAVINALKAQVKNVGRNIQWIKSR